MNHQFWHSLFVAVILLGCLLVQTGRGQFLESVIPVGDTPLDVIWNSTSNKVYVSNEQDGSVTVIDGATNQIRATIAVADYPFDICHNSVLNKIYVASGEGSNRVNVIDGSGDTLIKKIVVSHNPIRMTFNGSLNKLYAYCNDDPYSRVAVIDGTTDEVVQTISLRAANQLLWVPTTNRVLCYTDMDEDTVKAIDCVTDEVVARLPLPTGPDWLTAWCYCPFNDLVYLAARREVYVLTPRGDSVVAVVPKVTEDFGEFGVMPNLRKLYVLDGGWLLAIDCVTNTVADSLRVGGGVLACDTMKMKAYTNAGGACVVDARADTVIDSIPFGRTTNSMCFNYTNSRLYVSDYRDDCVWVVRDTTTGVCEPPNGISPTERRVATVTRGALLVGDAGADLFGANGRRVAVLQAGMNDIGHLPPGAYLVRTSGRKEPGKVILTR